MKVKVKARNKSTVSALVYMLEHFPAFAGVGCIFWKMIFVPIDGVSEQVSVAAAVGCVMAAYFLGCVIRWKRYMTTMSVLADTTLGLGIYMILAFWMRYVPEACRCLLIGTVIFLVAEAISSCMDPFYDRSVWEYDAVTVRRILGARIRRSIHSMGMWMGLLMAMLLAAGAYINRMMELNVP